MDGARLTPPSSGARGGAASSTDKQAFLVAHLPVRMAGQLSPAAHSLGARAEYLDVRILEDLLVCGE